MSQPTQPLDFEQHVIDSLARLETNMTALIGNGKDGRIDKIEDRVLWLLWAIAVLGAVVLGPQAVAFLK